MRRTDRRHHSDETKGTNDKVSTTHLDILETVLIGNVVHLASQNWFLRQQFARGVQDAKAFDEQFEQAVANDIDNAKQQLPNFLKSLAIPEELVAKLRSVHIDSFYQAVKSDAETTIAALEQRFLSHEAQVPPQVPAPVPPTPPNLSVVPDATQ